MIIRMISTGNWMNLNSYVIPGSVYLRFCWFWLWFSFLLMSFWPLELLRVIRRSRSFGIFKGSLGAYERLRQPFIRGHLLGCPGMNSPGSYRVFSWHAIPSRTIPAPTERQAAETIFIFTLAVLLGTRIMTRWRRSQIHGCRIKFFSNPLFFQLRLGCLWSSYSIISSRTIFALDRRPSFQIFRAWRLCIQVVRRHSEWLTDKKFILCGAQQDHYFERPHE